HLTTYNASLPSTAQTNPLPQIQTFLDALSVRKSVFCDEIKAVPMEHHVDADDGRSVHWCAYASVEDGKEGEMIPVGTIRLIPWPHYEKHPEPGSHFEVPAQLWTTPARSAEEIFFVAPPEFPGEGEKDKATEMHDGVEAYIKLGRLCVLKEYRGRGVANRLIETACAWARGNVEFCSGGKDGEEGWKGLVLVHAQVGARGTWERGGFEVDEGLEGWMEAGIEHLGMWRRVVVGE
ncbi:acyl-CoA N-acyltransferase, partial [Halenospora varia]